MSTAITREVRKERDPVEIHDFGVVDNKGRAVGALVYRATVEYAVDPAPSVWGGCTIDPGVWFTWCGMATRDGAGFGACQETHFCATPADREAQVMKYLKGASARAVRQWGRSCVGGAA